MEAYLGLGGLALGVILVHIQSCDTVAFWGGGDAWGHSSRGAASHLA